MKARKTTALLSNTLLVRAITICSIITLSIACKKDKDKPAPPPGDHTLVITFSNTSIDFGLVDSGYVVLKRTGTANQVFKRFEKKTNALSFSIDDLNAGDWTAEMYLFARFNASAGRRYTYDKTFTIPAGGAKENISLTAPTGAVTDKWKPYAFFRHEAQGVSIAVALDNTNPHFDVVVKDTKWALFYIERYANNRFQGGANAKVAEQIWSCETGCYTSDKIINNHTGFIPFVQEVGNKEWNYGLIIIVLQDGQGGAIQFTHSYNR